MRNPVTPSAETERISRVYQEYRASAAVQARWDLRNLGNQAILRERQLAIRRLLDKAGLISLTGKHVLEIGCGSGGVLATFRALCGTSANLLGVDLLPDRIVEAAQNHTAIDFLAANGQELPIADASIDLVLFFTVFSSILDQHMAREVAAEAIRVLKPGGAVLWYDFRYDNPRNPHVRGMSRRSLRSLFLGFGCTLRTVTLLPPLARRLGSATPLLYPALVRLPLLRTHYLALLRKPTGNV